MTKILSIYNRLNSLSSGRITFLKAENNFQLLIGVILSAQTTDKQVNEILPDLFEKFPDPGALGSGNLADIIDIIRPVGFFNVKAENIRAAAGLIHSEYNNSVPGKMDDLLKLPGVGRKSANVILGACFDQPAIIVDTHFSRVVSRLGLTGLKGPEKIEMDLKKKVPEHIQYEFSMLINKLGRDFCKARKPLCGECPVENYCPRINV